MCSRTYAGMKSNPKPETQRGRARRARARAEDRHLSDDIQKALERLGRTSNTRLDVPTPTLNHPLLAGVYRLKSCIKDRTTTPGEAPVPLALNEFVMAKLQFASGSR